MAVMSLNFWKYKNDNRICKISRQDIAGRECYQGKLGRSGKGWEITTEHNGCSTIICGNFNHLAWPALYLSCSLRRENGIVA